MLFDLVRIELNLEMAATPEMIRIASKTKPEMVTLVPEKRQELTTEGGLDVKANRKQLMRAIASLHRAGIPVSLFINPDPEDIRTSKDIGADMVEIHTGMYADAPRNKIQRELNRVAIAVDAAHVSGITVNVGHGLNYHNVQAVTMLDGIRGLYIGHSIISRAVLTGLEAAVREMKSIIQSCVHLKK